MAELITIICKRTIVSTKPVQAGKSYPLSVLDSHMEHNHVRIVLYYPSVGAPAEPGEITGRLRESLAVMLTHFPIVSGRLQKNDKDQWTIKCNDAGVRMLEAKAKGSLEGWLRNVDRDKELMLVYWEEMYHKPYFWSTFYVQITEFEDGADPTCATMFIKAWADTTFLGKMLSPPFFYPLPPQRPGNIRPNHKLYNSLIQHYKASVNKSIDLVDKKHTTVSFGFSEDMVRACMEMAQTIGANDKSGPSPFEALAGLFWVCISKVKGVRNGFIDMSISMDVRKVLGLDKGFFGNCMIYNKAHLESFRENTLSHAATSIAEVAKMDYEGIMDLIEWLQCNDGQSPSLMNGCDLICVSLEAVDPFSAIFEDEIAPIHVSCYIKPVLGLGEVLILPAKPIEGQLSRVVVMVTLPRNEVIKLCEDDLILRLFPTIMMDLNKT